MTETTCGESKVVSSVYTPTWFEGRRDLIVLDHLEFEAEHAEVSTVAE